MPITFALSPFQLICCVVVTFASVALSYLLGLDEGRVRGRIEGRRLAREAREKARQQLSEEAWFPNGGSHE